MSRSCGWCLHSRRSALEGRVLDGEAIRVVALDSGYSESAGQRHFRNHVRVERLAQTRAAVAIHLSDFASRLVELSTETSAVRAYAVETSDPHLLLKAVAVERDTIVVLLNRLGIDDAETVEMLTDAKLLVRAVSRTLADQPALAREMSDWLSSQGGSGLADALSTLAATAEASPTTQTTPLREISA